MVKPCVTVSSKSEPCVTARVERVGKPCVAVSSTSEPCVTARVETVGKPCVTVSSTSEPCVTARVEYDKKPGATGLNELCVTARVREGDEPRATVQGRGEEELTETIAQGEEESQSHATLPIKKRVSWLPSSSEEDNSAESEGEDERRERNKAVLELPMDGWKLPNWEEEERDYVLLPRIQEAVDIILGGATTTKVTEAERSSTSDPSIQPNRGWGRWSRAGIPRSQVWGRTQVKRLA